MTTAQLSIPPIFRAYDNSGNPLAGGLLYTYAAGTTTPQATYPSQSEATPNPNPVVLNYRGEAAVWLDPGLSYKFLLQDQYGNTIPGYPVDNIQGTVSASVGNLIPLTGNTYYLGSASVGWANVYVGSPPIPVYNAVTNTIGSYGTTTAETAAGVTVVNSNYAPGIVDRYATNTTPGTTDMTAAMRAAMSQMIQGGAPVQFLAETYLHTGSSSPMIITNSYQGAVIYGVPQRTIIINQGTAGSCPTIQIYGGSYFFIYGLLISGRAGYSNPGIQIIDDGTYRCGFGRISKMIGFTNNVSNGFIDIVNSNTIYLEDIDYWPTSSDPSGIPDGGATIDNGGQFAGIYMHGGSQTGSLSGNTNDIHILRMNTSGVNQSATFTGSVGGASSGTLTGWTGGSGVFPFMFQNGQTRSVTVSGTAATWTGALSAGTITTAPNGATILVDGETGTPPAFGTIIVSDVLAERTKTQSIWFRHVWNSSIRDCYLAGANVTLDNNCNRCELDNVDIATAQLLIDGTQTAGGNTRIDVKQVDCKYLVCDSANQYINQQNVNVVTTYTQNGTYVTNLNLTVGGTNGSPDLVGGYGLGYGIGVQGASLSNGGTIAGLTTGGTVWTYAPSASVTGIIVSPPVDQTKAVVIEVVNESASHTITMAVSGSNVADGSSCVIAANNAMRFVWSPHTTLWYHYA
jgi:hypothetical protein